MAVTPPISGADKMTMVDPYATTNALARGYDQMHGMATNRALRTAGNALAGNDVQGAKTALGGVGDIQSVQALQQGQERQAQAMREQEDEDQKEVMGFLTQGATALMQAPYEQRQQLYVEVLRPTLEQMGYDPQVLMQLDQADKSDANLRSLIVAAGGDMPQRPGGVNVGGGRIVERDPYTGEYVEVYQAPIDPLDAEYRQAQIDALRAQQGQREAQAARARRPAAPHGGGGSSRGGGGGSAAPSGGGRPWERFR